jgi:uncharacterized damage-inducible protein DinB
MLQPVAHALILADEDIRTAVSALSHDRLWRRIADSASIGFHLMHLAGSTDRLLTYARGEGLDDAQKAALDRERRADEEQPTLEVLLRDWHEVLNAALEQLRSTPPDANLAEPRFVGRARLPSTVIGLLFHAAEHAARHTGQVVTTARIITTARAVTRST